MLGIDYSTINLKALRMLPNYVRPPTYHVDQSMGSGCFLDPPGYPSYFLQSVYTSYGNSPRRGSTQYVIMGRALPANMDDLEGKREKVLRKLWAPLPLEHPRTMAWMQYVYKYFNHCYLPASGDKKADSLIIYPVPDYKLRAFVDDERFSDEWRAKEQAAVKAYNDDLIGQMGKLATPDRHRAVDYIREFYPEHQPRLDWITSPPQSPGDWWETLPRRPSPEECPGNGRHGEKHPVNKSWCQVCGWREKAA